MRSPEEQMSSLAANFRTHPELFPSLESRRYYVVLCDCQGKPVRGPISRRFHVHNQWLRILALTDVQTEGLLVFLLEEPGGNP